MTSASASGPLLRLGLCVDSNGDGLCFPVDCAGGRLYFSHRRLCQRPPHQRRHPALASAPAATATACLSSVVATATTAMAASASAALPCLGLRISSNGGDLRCHGGGRGVISKLVMQPPHPHCVGSGNGGRRLCVGDCGSWSPMPCCQLHLPPPHSIPSEGADGLAGHSDIG